MGINMLKKMGLRQFSAALCSRCIMPGEWLRGGRGRFALTLYLLGFLFFSILSARAETLDLNFSTQIKPDPCTVTLTGEGGGGAEMKFGDVNSADIIRSANNSPVKVFQMTLSGCGVDAQTASLFQPTITVSGDGGTTYVGSSYVFRGPTSTSEGYGFFMNFNNTKVKWQAGGVPAADVANINLTTCNKIKISGTCAKLPDSWWRTPINIAVAPTSSANSASEASSLRSGSVIANVRFTFDYP
ncbi:fimbrial protein [Enterobacter asburiae]|uniref:fimbrial protein n=1 Tax=Enterobacter asburiae TaxID=61645 RepID=UPI0021D1CF9F|nr:hypothetical protein [Enterobacter asburiae]MCU6244084.1 hypothetical protein [Enterobacter asburiae]